MKTPYKKNVFLLDEMYDIMKEKRVAMASLCGRGASERRIDEQ